MDMVLTQLSGFGRLAWWVGMATDAIFHDFGSRWQWECAFLHGKTQLLHGEMHFYMGKCSFASILCPGGSPGEPGGTPGNSRGEQGSLGRPWGALGDRFGALWILWWENAVLEKWCQENLHTWNITKPMLSSRRQGCLDFFMHRKTAFLWKVENCLSGLWWKRELDFSCFFKEN